MPSFIIHASVAKEYNKKHKLDDLLFIVGSIAPDCWRNSKLFGYENRYLSHFTNTQLNNENEDYQMFFLKYHNHLDNPFYLGYLIHLITDTFWRDVIYKEYELIINKKMDKEKLNNYIRNENHYLDSSLIKYYQLKEFPIYESQIPLFNASIDEIDLTGLFGPSGTLAYANNIINNKENNKPKYINFEHLLNDINRTVEYVEKELNRLKTIERK